MSLACHGSRSVIWAIEVSFLYDDSTPRGFGQLRQGSAGIHIVGRDSLRKERMLLIAQQESSDFRSVVSVSVLNLSLILQTVGLLFVLCLLSRVERSPNSRRLYGLQINACPLVQRAKIGTDT